MSTYRKIHGRSIQAVTTDPTETVSEGQVWYNTTSDTFKTTLVNESFTSVSALNTARDALQVGSVGTQTAGIAFGGRTHPPESFKNETEEYNGTGWSESGNLNDARFSGAGFGTQTAAVMAGGNRPSGSPDGRSDVEEYDGSSWTNATDIPAGRYGAMGAGTLTAGIVAGGATGTYPFTAQSTSFEYDGTNWTSGGTMNKGRWIGASGGPQTAALFFGGSDTTGSPNTTNTESYDGTSFTALSALPTANRLQMGSGDTSSAVSYGGGPGTVVTTAFTWDGSSWSTSPATLGTARDEGSSSGTGSAAVTGGGSPPDAGLSIAEEYNKSATVITAAAFSSGGNINTARYDIVGTGLQTAAVAAGGYSSSRVGNTENYDGSAWTNSSTKPTAVFAGAMVGTQTAAFYASGNNAPSGGRTASTEEYDGSNWTSGGNVNTARQQIGAQNGGTLTAGIIFGGNGGPTATEHYDGTSWTTQPATLNDGRWNAIGTGNQTAAVMAGADNPATSNVEEYNGTSWSEVNNLPEIRYSGATIGTAQTDYIIASGQAPGGYLTSSVRYDGTNWATSPSNSTARSLLGGSSQAPTSAGLIYGGYLPSASNSNATEEFTGETAAVNVKTLTQS